MSAGTDVISYTVNNSCGTAVASKTVTINPLPVAGTITGPANVCTGNSIVLADASPGGVWTSSSAGVTIAGGVVTGVAAGTDTIKYTVTNSCGVVHAATTISVNTLPDIGTISGVDTICTGISLPMLDAVTGGVWSISNDHITITGAGMITAVSPGLDTITYARTNTCGTTTTSHAVDVKTGPVAGIVTGGTSICAGAKDTLAGTPLGGSWSSSNANATVTSIATGVIITGVSAGADTIIYTISNECGPAAAVFPITVLGTNVCDSVTGVAPSPSTGSGQAGAVLRVWPNPNQGVFTVILSSNTDEPIQVVVTNLVGEKVREVITTTNKATEIQLNNAAGVYFVTASDKQGNYVAKVVFTQ